MSSNLRVRIAVLIVFGAAAIVHASQTYTLDFVAGRPAAERQESEAKQTRRPKVDLQAGSSNQVSMPFEVTLLSLDRNRYTIGDDILFEVLLQYTGSRPVAFPWSRDASSVVEAPHAQIAHILVTFTDQMLGRQLLGFENVLYGADTVPGSQLLLHHGDSIRVRAASRWWLSMGFAQRPTTGWVRNLSIKAELQWRGTPTFEPLVDSSNTLAVELRERQ